MGNVIVFEGGCLCGNLRYAARGKPVTFRAYWNYSAWIERAELRIFHANRSTDGKPLAERASSAATPS